ncbi:MAG: TIGR02597 family protein [Verrucomicrobiaceae bacterium]|nr:TIGR02597 family protein [Verrucomicrobiaceae bacterium]
MKKLALITALAATSVVSSFGQVTTKAVGFVTLNLQTGNNFVGFSLQPSAAFSGAFTVSATDRSHIFLTNATVTDDQFNGAAGTYVMEVTTAGTNEGLNTVITDTIATGAEVVLQDALPAGVADGSTLTIWKLRTIADAFGATNSAGLTAGTASTADLIMLPNGAGGFDQYFYSNGGFTGTGWRKVGAGTANQANVAFYYSDGFLIAAKSAKSITITGEVKSGKTSIVLETGNNLLANLCPVNAGGTSPSTEGRTLGNSGLYTGNPSTGILGNTTAATADQVMIWNGTGYNQYYYSTGGFTGVGWRLVGGGNTDRATVALPDGCYLVLRRGAPVTVQLAQGAF